MSKQSKTARYMLGEAVCLTIVALVVCAGVTIWKNAVEKEALASRQVYEVYVSEKETKEKIDSLNAVTYHLKLHDEAEVYDMVVEKDDYSAYKKGDKVSVVKYDGKWLLKK